MQSIAMSAKASSLLRRSMPTEQVAAVCYRIGKSGIEFLLVQTGAGRWTFPKGNVEAGLTHAQSAALEAVEEAGVHGCIEEESFARYDIRKRKGVAPVTVFAHLCEVTRRESAQESRRNPTWFSAAKAKRRLQEHRISESRAEFARVLDIAVTRIQSLRHPTPMVIRAQRDPLQEVRIESPEPQMDAGRLYQALVRDLRRGEMKSSVIQLAVGAYVDEAPRLNPPPEATVEIENSQPATSTFVGDW